MKKSTTSRGVLEADAPPTGDQIVVYYVAEHTNDITAIHVETCPTKKDGKNLRRVETTGDKFCESLGASGANKVCAYCHGEQWKLLITLLKRSEPCWSNLVDAWIDSSLLLRYEAFKPGNVDAWCLWSTKRTAEQITARAREEIEWGEQQETDQLMVFEADGFDERSLVLSVGDHMCVQRTDGIMRDLKVHGLIPAEWSTWGGDDERISGILVPVGAEFSRTHMGLAVALYEQTEALILSGALPHEQAAENAVQTARLVLA